MRGGGVTGQVRLNKELHMEFWWENLRERDHLEELGVDESLF
jgi:hypothetical protein